jgi:zinc/manganese transport system substrate-binding protein
MASVLSLPFVQRGLIEVAVLAIPAGILGTWIVLRGLPFYVHATGTAAFPGLVLADGLAFSPFAGALGTAALFALLVALLGRRDRDTPIAVLLAGALAAGALLASDVFHSGARVDELLFGSLLLISGGDIAQAAGLAVAALAGSALLGQRWLARGFDERTMPGSRAAELALLALVALAVVVALRAIGGLLVASLFVVPAATTRLFVRRPVPWQLATIAVAALEGAAGIVIAVYSDAPPGATIALVSGGLFGLAVVARALGRRRAIAIATAAAATVGAAGCTSVPGGEGRPVVVATTTQLADVTRAVAGPHTVDVFGVLRPNTDPHEYEPRPSDIRATAAAALVLRSGDGLDGWMTKVVGEAGGHPRVLDLGADVPVDLGGDPHWWHDPRNVEAAVPVIRDALIRLAPNDTASLRRNAAAYLQRLRALDRGIARCFSRIAPSRRLLVTDHDALGYFANRYGLQIVGAVIPSQSTEGQASAGDLAALSKTIRRLHVRAVFPESSVSARVAKALASETGVRSDLRLYGDTLGPAGSRGATYLGMEAANADAMALGMTGRGCA